MRIETALAKAAMSLVDQREPKNIHHKMTLAAFTELAPSFDWKAYLAEVGAPSFSSLDVADPGFFKGLEPPLKSLPLKDWKAYLRWCLIDALVSMAPKAFVDEDFAFFGKRLDGQAEDRGTLEALRRRDRRPARRRAGRGLRRTRVQRGDESARSRHDARDRKCDARRYQVH